MKCLNTLMLISALILLCSFSFALTQETIAKTANEMYLLNPLDNSETIVNSNSVIYNNANYWVIQTNDNDFFILNDKNYLNLIQKEIIKPTLETYFFFSKLDKKYDNQKIAYFFNTLPNTITNFNYNIELIKKELENSENFDENVYVALQNVQLRIKEIGEISIDITKNTLFLDKNFEQKSYENYKSSANIHNNLENDINKLTYKLTDLQNHIMTVKIILVDSNIALEMKTVIGNELLTLPPQFQNIPEYISNLNTNLSLLNNAIQYANNYENINQHLNSWDLRLKRQLFLQMYLNTDNDIDKTTQQKNAKTLFDMIISNKDQWKDYNKTVAFNNAYAKMYSDLEKNDFDNAKRQIKPLKDMALIIYKDGKKEENTINYSSNNSEDNTTDNQTNPIITIMIIVIAEIVLVIIIISIIKKIKEANEKKEKEEQEIEVKF